MASVDNLAPSVVVYKDLSLTEYEDVYEPTSINVNWQEEQVSAYYVDEDQAGAAGTVLVEDAVYHKHILNITVDDIDNSSTPTQDAQIGDIITITVAALELSSKKCEILSMQRTVSGNESLIRYNMTVAYYELFSL